MNCGCSVIPPHSQPLELSVDACLLTDCYNFLLTLLVDVLQSDDFSHIVLGIDISILSCRRIFFLIVLFGVSSFLLQTA